MSCSDSGPYVMKYLRYFNGKQINDKGINHCEARVLGLGHGLRLIDDWNRQGAYRPEFGVWTYKALSVNLTY